MTLSICVALSVALAQAPPPSAASAESVLREAMEDMLARQRNGGWVTKYAAGNEVLWGEHKPRPDGWITMQPPATPEVAGVFLRAGKVLDEPRYIAAAKSARDALSHIQTEAGGFPHEGDPTEGPASAATLDDDTTTGTLRFLIHWWRHTYDDADERLIKRVGAYLLTAQYPSGGWPQYYPYRDDHYNRYITFNDADMVNAIRALFTLHEMFPDGPYEAAALRGVDCILKLQGGEGEAIWAQQYDAESLEPAWARTFEPPGYSARESRGVCTLLAALYVRYLDDRYLDSIRRALHWYDTHKTEAGTWYRLYEPGSQRPLFGRRDKAVKVYDQAEATGGYSWEGAWYPEDAAALVRSIDAGERPSPRRVGLPLTRSVPSKERAASAAIAAVSSADAEGRWSTRPTADERATLKEHGVAEDTKIVSTQAFVRHANALLDWIETADRLVD